MFFFLIFVHLADAISFYNVEQSVSLAHIHSAQTQLFGHLSPIFPAQGSGTTSIDSNMLPKDDEHMDRNKAAILCRQQEEFLKGSEEALNAEEVDLD